MKMKYTTKELDDFALRDLEIDLECAEEQAKNGPYFPGVTKESLLAYAKECREKIDTYKQGGAHAAILNQG